MYNCHLQNLYLTIFKLQFHTQQLCVNDAVLKENKTPATEDDLKPKYPEPGDNSISQQVTFTSKFVEHASEITEAMSISGPC